MGQIKRLLARAREHRTKPEKTCRIIQQSDEMVCVTCGLRWDVGDEKPCEDER